MTKMDEFQRIIIGGLLHSDPVIAAKNRQTFIKKFTSETFFRNEYFVYSLVYFRFKNISETTVSIVLETQKSAFLKSKQVDTDIYGGVEGYYLFSQHVLDELKKLEELEIAEDLYNETVEAFVLYYQNLEFRNALVESNETITEGLSNIDKITNNTDFIGKTYDKAKSDLLLKVKQIDNLNSKEERRGLIDLSKDKLQSGPQNQTICMFGLPTLDEHTGGLREGQMVSLLAPPKGGKSRIATFFLHNAVRQGKNVLMWSIENGPEGWEALMRARQFEYYYNEREGSMDKLTMQQSLTFSDKTIRQNNFGEDGLREKENISWTSLRTGAGYGKVYIIDEDFNAETFLPILDQYVDETEADVICIDYLQLITGSGDIPKHQRIADAYASLLQFLKKKKIAGFFPGQIKQTGVSTLNRLDKDKIAEMDFRDIAGESAEVIRTPDLNLLLGATQDDMRNNRMVLINIGSREVENFDPIKLNLRLGVCTLTEDTENY